MDGMHRKQNEIEYSQEIKVPLALSSLRRSNIRKKVAEYLFDISPSYSYTSDIAYNIKTTPSNVIGAIRGMGSRYKVEESLLALGIIEMKTTDKNIRLYGLTPFGKEIIEHLKNRG